MPALRRLNSLPQAGSPPYDFLIASRPKAAPQTLRAAGPILELAEGERSFPLTASLTVTIHAQKFTSDDFFTTLINTIHRNTL